jgi:hypothetical protein
VQIHIERIGTDQQCFDRGQMRFVHVAGTDSGDALIRVNLCNSAAADADGSGIAEPVGVRSQIFGYLERDEAYVRDLDPRAEQAGDGGQGGKALQEIPSAERIGSCHRHLAYYIGSGSRPVHAPAALAASAFPIRQANSPLPEQPGQTLPPQMAE